MSKEDLESTTGLRVGHRSARPPTRSPACAIERKYQQEKGYLFAKVDLVEGDKPTDTRVIFRITEGSTVKISSIEFTGVEFVTPQHIRTQVQSSSASSSASAANTTR